MIRILTILICCVLCFSVVGAQEATPIYKSDPNLRDLISPNSVSWSSDSQTLFFDLAGSEPIHYQYDTNTSQLTQISALPFVKTLTVAQQEHFRAWKPTALFAPDGQNFIYLSQFDTYLQFEGYGYWHLFAVGNLESETFLPLRLPNTGIGFRIRWSEDGSTFVIELDGAYGGVIALIHVRTRDWCEGVPFCAFDERYVAQIYWPQAIYDLSSDGRKLLFPYGHGVQLWDSVTDAEADHGSPDGLFIDQGNIVGAAFLPNDDNHILIVNEAGIGRYSIETGELEIINTRVDSTWAGWAMFSPDNEKVAVLAGGSGAAKEQIFVLPSDIDSLTPQATTAVQ